MSIVIGVFLLLLAALSIYVTTNNEFLKRKLSEAINKRTSGETQVGEISTGFTETFPFLSVKISDLTIRDSAYARHKIDLLKAEKAFVRISIFRLLFNVKPDRVILENGRINIFKDTTGFDNTYVFKTADKEKKESDKPDASKYPDVQFKNMVLDYKYPDRDKDHNLLARNLLVKLEHDKGILNIKAEIDFFVNQIAFNTKKGGYLKKSSFKSNLELVYNTQLKQLSFNKQTIYFNDLPYVFTGMFSLVQGSPDYTLSIRSNKASYDEITRILPEKVSEKLAMYKVKGDFIADATIKGRTSYKFKPLVAINFKLDNGSVVTKDFTLDKSQFTGRYYNQVERGKIRDDLNSSISFYNVKGKMENIDLKADSMVILNLKKPVLKTHIYTDLALKDLNSLSGSSTMKFTTGRAVVDVQYVGPMTKGDTVSTTMNGSITIKDGGMTYIPRQFVMNNTNGKILMKDNHLIVDQLKLNTGKTSLVMNGRAENFLSLLNVSPDQLLLKWNISSPHLYLDDYKGFIAKRSSQKKSNPKAMFGETADKIDKMFMNGTVRLTIQAKELEYNKFQAENMNADISLLNHEARINNVSMNHAKGKLDIKGTLKEGNELNELDFQSNLTNINLPIIFNAFSDFGQDALTSKNIAGNITAEVRLKTAITNDAKILRNRNSGTIDFIIEDFELNNFEPIQKISQKVFKKQDFSQIKFADLKNRLVVDGSAFKMERMEIRSTAITMFVRGVYDVQNGTDMRIVLPVKNLLGSNADTDLTDEGKSKRGVSIRLRAKTGDDGKLQVGWDPLRRGGKVTD